jgi:tol-pal system protein YbgF
MRNLRRVLSLGGILALLSMSLPLFAESAPVYDADNMQQQFDNSGELDDQSPPPSLPSQEGAYVPQQQMAPSSNSLTLEQRTRRLEQQLANMQGSESNAKVDSLQTQIQTLRGQVEQLTHDLQQMQTQQKSMYSDLDKRLNQQPPLDSGLSNDANNKIAAKPASKNAPAAVGVTSTTPSDAAKATVNQPNVAEEQQIYQTAYNLIKAKKYNDAVDALQKMLQKYPSGQFAANAHYWLGELYGVLGKTDQALSEFNQVVKDYANSPRVSDAQLKVGLILASQSKWSEAKQAFKKVINRYPGSASARLASDQLKQIKQAGH